MKDPESNEHASDCHLECKAGNHPQFSHDIHSKHLNGYHVFPSTSRHDPIQVNPRPGGTKATWSHLRDDLDSSRSPFQLDFERLKLMAWLTLISFSLAALFLPANLSFAAAPDGFPKSGNGLWYRSKGSSWSREWLPVGNGYLAAMTPGGTSQEVTQLNIESLWTGGLWEDPLYVGGNKDPSQRVDLAKGMQDVRQAIFQSPNGTIDDFSMLGVDASGYGTYSGAGNLITTIDTPESNANYARWLDMDRAVVHATWGANGDTLVRSTFCSHSARACVQHLNTTGVLPQVTYAFDSAITGLPQPTITCLDSSTLHLRGSVSESGMSYEIISRVVAEGHSTVKCSQLDSFNATISVQGATSSWITWVGDTEYNIDAGDAAHNFTFRRELPHDELVSLLDAATSQSFESVLTSHVRSYTSLLGGFSLSIGHTPDLSRSTDELKEEYKVDDGNPYLEWLMFNFGRYLLASSAPGVLPANLQGKWARDAGNPWSSDYHANINLQMNYWAAEMTNMHLVKPLFDYMQKTWVPRGTETARTLYNSRGWVVHNEMNIFGHTGMKAFTDAAEWANYPESAAWMMLHVWDHFDYTNDVAWWRNQGWNLIKGHAQFQLDKLVPDDRFNDSSLVVAPCNSPEQAPITLGCAHAQQLIWQLFNAIEKGFEASGDDDKAFLEEVRQKRSQMDKGVHRGSWGQLQEWKVDMDSPRDTHRHLSHLIGLYPGYALANYNPTLRDHPSLNNSTYTKDDVLDAARISLIHRGDGTGSDADSGWEKMWRAAAWAQLTNATGFYHELTYSIERNHANNLFSMYNPGNPDPIFQIDANLAYPAVLLNALLQAPDVPSISTPLVVTVLPALPSAWPSGSVKGARIRGAMSVDLEWDNGRPTFVHIRADNNAPRRQVRVEYDGRTVKEFTTIGGLSIVITF